MNKQRILVLGCNDAIGRRVATKLAASDWARVAVLKSQTSGSFAFPLESIDIVPNDGLSLAKALPHFDGIVAAFAGSPKAIHAQARALFANHERPIEQRIVHVSSMTVYGEVLGTVDETFPFGEVLSPYAHARVESEKLALFHSNVVTLRPGCEYGPNCFAWSTRVAQWLAAHRVGDLGARGDGICNLVYVDDVATAALNALRVEGIAGQAFNLAMPLPPSWNEYFTQFAKSLRAVPIKRISGRRLKIETKLLAPPLKIAEIGARFFGLRAVSWPLAIPPSAAQEFLRDFQLSANRATQTLGIQWTSLDQGLRKTVQWLQ